MSDLVTISIGLGLVINLAFTEFLGVGTGGMIVPGYLALYLDQPVMILLTLLASYLTYFIVHVLSTFMIIYGRRRTVLMILVGFLLGWFIRSLGSLELPIGNLEMTIVGYIIPGLIAIWVDRQGTIETFSSLITAGVMVRLALILLTGGQIN